MKKAADAINRFSNSRGFYIVLYSILGLLAVLSIYAGIKNAYIYSQDFQYDAAKALIMGYDPWDISLAGEKSPKIEGLEEYYAYYESINAPQKMEANQFPSLLYLLAPWCILGAKSARIVWLISNLFFTVCILVLLGATFFKETELKNFVIFALLMICGTPWRNQLGVGQHTLFSVAFFLLAVFLSEKAEKNRALWIPAGLCLSVAYFKYTLTVPMTVYFIYKRKWKEVILSAVPHILLTVYASTVLGEPVMNMFMKPLKVASELSSSGSIDLGAFLGGGSVSMVVTLLIMAGLAVFGFLCPDRRENDALVISVCVLLANIMTYHRMYDFFIMIVVFSYFNNKRPAVEEALYSLVCCAVFFLPRIFNDSPASLVAAAIPYYLFTVWMISEGIRAVYDGRGSGAGSRRK